MFEINKNIIIKNILKIINNNVVTLNPYTK